MKEMNNWYQTTIGEQITLQRGFDITKKQLNEGNVPVISSSGVSYYHDTSKVYGPGVIIGRKGTLGTVHFVKGDFWPHDTTLWVKEFNDNVPQFVYYFLKSLNLKQLDTGSANPTLNRNHVHPIKILWPSKDVQNKIAKILGNLDEKIDLNNKMNKALEKMAMTLYKHWFVDFGPFQDGKFVESELGMIPKGWEIVNVERLADIIGGGTPKTSVEEYWNGDIPWISVKDLNETMVIDTEKKITQLGLEKSSTKLLPSYSTVLSARGTIGNISIIGSKMCMNQSCYAIKSEQNIDCFIFLSLKLSIDNLISRSHGSVFNTITKSTLQSLKFAFNTEVTLEFEDKVKPLFDSILSNICENSRLTEIRDYLLPRLISGEIDITEGEKTIKKVMKV